MDETPEREGWPPELRFLKRLVTALTAVLIGGCLAVVALLVIRLSGDSAPDFPQALQMPEGAVPAAVTRGDGFVAVVTRDGRILIFDTAGRLTQEVQVTRP